MKPPDIITRYVEAANTGEIEAATACFSTDATVEDEHAIYRGSTAIREWIDDTTAKYQPRTEVLESGEAGGTIEVAVRVSGSFPGSPIELEYRFTLEDGTISQLSIE